MRWPPAPPPLSRASPGRTPPLAPLLTRSAADVFRKATDVLRAAASPTPMGVANGSCLMSASYGGGNGAKADSGALAAAAAAERKVVWLSPLQWVIAAGAWAVPCEIRDAPLRQLLHEILTCAPRKGGIGVMPKLPQWNGHGAPHACSLELYILRQYAAACLSS